jgi:uncharacterized membrane protein YfcA
MGAVQLMVFAFVMLLAAVFMLRSQKGAPDPGAIPKGSTGVIGVEGFAVGILTGFVGVGGGFIIIPALVLLRGLSMHVAVGTSLAIIAMKSFAGFWKYLDVLEESGLSLDWNVVVTFTLVGAVGSLVGNVVGGHVPQAHLRRGFSFFLLIAGAFILWQSVPQVL